MEISFQFGLEYHYQRYTRLPKHAFETDQFDWSQLFGVSNVMSPRLFLLLAIDVILPFPVVEYY